MLRLQNCTATKCGPSKGRGKKMDFIKGAETGRERVFAAFLVIEKFL